MGPLTNRADTNYTYEVFISDQDLTGGSRKGAELRQFHAISVKKYTIFPAQAVTNYI